jgi:hypothetical protein
VRFLSIAGGLALISCAAPHTPAETRTTIAELGGIPSGVARVCVIRPERAASNVTMEVRDNGRLVGATRGTTFFCWLAAPGEHQITSIDDDTGPTLLVAKANARYWLHQEVSAIGGDVHAHLDWVDDTTAGEMIDACDARVLVSVPGHDDRTDAMPLVPARRKL